MPEVPAGVLLLFAVFHFAIALPLRFITAYEREFHDNTNVSRFTFWLMVLVAAGYALAGIVTAVRVGWM